ncbi:FOG: Transposon-encoded proteins with TYA, reverse transcriptase, integrase domains in various combinations [Plasmopara halstedii]|uniref:FOG: Transposon-encoded proteins with TYA, reverse transcriptase, integrase domains in various combinations n=1 Tax=Plasmopara halstedii TaxID=4781 RepID=A0A0P1AMM2_PLAHL|nr:FOG: Transposon-encoded proteins with TYA, reverse transcriptase, integrase domains in various combinations [Plasmopara halstedii]CEG42617.1 FOG: Transposon-encoded proteins with TYA, reverse transcriptase, integrase domains in various combinations [Plasmopara halstedii]|eukprot:XP_024578986.1 FOG: Transposon-encoded proteins with TYA, reverse transcriptase, integrase domains in various combinations [Plasmopara halstedii]
MLEEIPALQIMVTGMFFKRPTGANMLHSKRVFKTKTNANGAKERLKAWLVACGNKQGFGNDYALTFAAVMVMSIVQVILGLAARRGVPAKLGDIPSAYVNADKEKDLEILLHVPSGMDIKDKQLKKLGATNASEVALELKKSLYGLKQAGQLWSQLLHARFTDAGFKQCISDMCLNFKREEEVLTVVGVYVDDLLVTTTRAAAVEHFFCR